MNIRKAEQDDFQVLIEHDKHISHMKFLGHSRVMTSTLSNENAQRFYRKSGYMDAGSLLLPGESLEIIFIKVI